MYNLMRSRQYHAEAFRVCSFAMNLRIGGALSTQVWLQVRYLAMSNLVFKYDPFAPVWQKNTVEHYITEINRTVLRNRSTIDAPL